MKNNLRLFFASLGIAALVLAGCATSSLQESEGRTEAGDATFSDAFDQRSSANSAAGLAEAFDNFTDELIEEMLERSPEWAIYQGRYEHAGKVTIPDESRRREEVEFADRGLTHLAGFDYDRLPVRQQTDHDLLSNRLEAMKFYTESLRAWEWQPSHYNVAGPLSLLLNTDFAPLEERLALIRQRLDRVPDYYQAARASLGTPSLEHTRLAIQQNQGTLGVLSDIRHSAEEAGLADDLADSVDQAQAAIEDWVDWLQGLQARLEESGEARSFRLGRALYEEKFKYDIQAGLEAAELYRRALDEKERLLAEMDGHATELWPQYFPDQSLPEDRLQRIGRMIDRLSDEHGTVDEFVDNVREQMPKLARFVSEKDLLDQDPDKPLVVRKTPEYMRGTGAIASVSAPGPFHPKAETYYNVTPLDSYGDELAASYLREYNDWMVQILNIHEAIPGHYTQLVHANKSPSLVKSLFGNGAMIEGWAVYSEHMMLEAGWGDHAPELLLMHGKWLLRVVHNTILDYAVHVLGMERDEALRLMREEAFQEESEATQKWVRVTLTQVQLTSYYAGYAAILDLRTELQNELGEDFDLKAFHNRFLSFGSAPVATIARLMTEGAN